MKYVGLQTQIARNNTKSIMLLLAFPCIMLGMVWVFLAILNWLGGGYYNQYGEVVHTVNIDAVNYYFINAMPWVIGGVGIWFCIAYFANVSMVKAATGARTLERRENPRIYNIVENLCMACGMDMPKINVVDDPQLNAFASGINKETYTVTVTTGLMDLLDDNELAGVIGHELTHIRNRDTRLLITSIVFVGIVSTIMSIVVRMLFNNMLWGGFSSRRSNERGGGVSTIVIMIVGVICCAIAYFFTLLTRFAISRKREYMADAGGAELCGDPLALASALRKISGDPGLQHVEREDVAQLFIVHPQKFASGFMDFFSSMFATHPDTAKRIAFLEQL
ncbi:MAG: M48 family metallopeptidase [Prevotella sp.]|jgi:heat shock protein HtpX|nr:M48 family metallopeptidase [Prevotella sp.]